MIKIRKTLSVIPNSLKIPKTGKSTKTHTRRMEIIEGGSYIDERKYNSRYKTEDIKELLKEIYKSKCAYCETHIEQFHVDHYRPKKIYYWLAFSWDNLLLTCPTCNQHKGVNFEVKNEVCDYDASDLDQINSCSSRYDNIENPLLINPEVTDPSGEIIFDMNGVPSSNDPKFAYTIKTCRLDRPALNDQRRKILDKFKEHVRLALWRFSKDKDQKISIKTVLENFISDSNKEAEEYLCFRKYAQKFLGDIIEEIRSEMISLKN